MTCEEAWPLLSGHMDGENTPEEEEELRAHLSICPACKELLGAYEGVDRQVARLKNDAPEGLKQGVMYRIQNEKQPRKNKRRWLIGPGTAVGVAAAILVLLVGTGKVQMPGLRANTAGADAQTMLQTTDAAATEAEEADRSAVWSPLDPMTQENAQTDGGDALLTTSAAGSADSHDAGDSSGAPVSGAEDAEGTEGAKRELPVMEITKQERSFCAKLAGDNTSAVLLLDGLSQSFPEQLAQLVPELGERLQAVEPEVQEDGTLVYETDYDTVMAIQEWFLLALAPQEDEELPQEQSAPEQPTQETTDVFEQVGWQRVLELDPQSGYLTAVLTKLPEKLENIQWPEEWPEDWNEKWKTGDNWALFFPEEHYEPVEGDLAYLVLTP